MQDSDVINTYTRLRGLQAHVTSRVMWAALAMMCAASWLLFSHQPFIFDLPLMHFVAWRVSAGDAPYVDVWDMNGPTTYMLHQLMLLSPLPPAATMAILMTVLTGGCVAAAAIIAGRGGRRWIGFMAGLGMLAWILVRGNHYVMQRDFQIAVLALGALLLLAKTGAKGWRWAAAGALIGLAVGVKPTAAPFALVAMAAAAWIDLGEGKRFTRTLWLVAGGAAGAAVWLGWLLATGGLLGFWHTMTVNNAGYMNVARQPLLVLLREPGLAVAAAGAMACGMAIGARARSGLSREQVGFLGLAAGFAAMSALTYVLQGKGWVYQAAPANILGVAAVAAAVATVRDLDSKARRWAMAACVAVTCIAAAFGVRDQLNAGTAEDQAWRVAMVNDMAADLGKLPPGMRVQPFDTADGAANAMWRAGRAPASPVMYDFWLFLGDKSGIAASRAAVLDAMNSKDAPAILMTNQGWPREGTGFARLRDFTELQTIIDARYTLVSEGRRGAYGYRLYAPS